MNKSIKENSLMRDLHLFLITICVLIASSLMSCNSNDENLCVNHFLEEFDMKPYAGEDLACKTHIRLYDYEGVLFAVKINHCTDFVAFTIYDCNGKEFCFTSEGPCYFHESIDLGIIGIEK